MRGAARKPPVQLEARSFTARAARSSLDLCSILNESKIKQLTFFVCALSPLQTRETLFGLSTSPHQSCCAGKQLMLAHGTHPTSHSLAASWMVGLKRSQVLQSA